MKLFSLRLTTLKSKLYAIVFASFVVRVVGFFLLPNKESTLGPDEGNYGELTKWIAQGKPADEYPYTTLYLISRSLIVPASLLNRLGVDGLSAVRVISSLYGLLTLCLAVSLFLKIANLRSEFAKWASNNQMKVLVLFIIFGFLPSHLTWSILGLRDSALEFWVMTIFALIFYIFEMKGKSSRLTLSGALLAILFAFSSRPQVGWVLGVTLLFYFSWKIKYRAAQILFPLTLVGIMLGYAATTLNPFEKTESFTVQLVKTNSSFKPSTQSQFNVTLMCKFHGQIIDTGDAKYKCSEKMASTTLGGAFNVFSAVVKQADAIPLRHELNKIDAISVIETQNCPNTGASRVDRFFCIAYRAPYSTFTFLFRPLVGADVSSMSSLFAALENVFWLGAFFFVVVMFIRNRRLAFFGALAPSLLFFSLYVLAAGAYEGNMGTAFRHKSLILWVVLLLMASTIVATQQRRAERDGISGFPQE
jgi:hypothetical protein